MEHIIHLPEYRIVVCKTCQYAVLPSEINAHFTPTRPHGFAKDVRTEIIQKIAEIEGLIKDKEELKHCRIPFPADTAEPISALEAPIPSGFRCAIVVEGSPCPYVCSGVQNIQKHCRKTHGWENPQKRGHQSKKSVHNMPWRSGVQRQRFFKQGPHSGFFEVRRYVRAESSTSQSKSAWEILQEKASSEFRRIGDIERQKIKVVDESREPNPWLRRTGWARHLDGFRQTKMMELVRPVGEEEWELGQVQRAFHRMVHAAMKIGVTDVVGQAALFEINRKEPSKKASKPFNSRMDKTTFRNYTTVWKQILSYIWRTDEMEEEERPPYKMTRRQLDALDHVGDVIETMKEFSSQSRESRSRESRGREKQAAADLESAILELCITLLDHQFGDHQYQSVIISGIAVLGLQEGGGWASAQDYTPKLLAVIKLARLIVVYRAYTLRKQSMQREIGRGVSQQAAEESASSHHQLTSRMVSKFMMLVDSKGEPHPMDWMLDTRTYGMYIRYHTAAGGSINWRGDTILYQQIQFSMQQLRTMVHGLVAEARRVLVRDLLLMQLDEHGDVEGEPLPPIDWASTVDNPTEKRLGWSFLKDVRNQFEMENPGGGWLARRVVETPGLSRVFIQGTGGAEGGAERGVEGAEGAEQIRWRRCALDRYYRRVEYFQEQLLILMHMTGGQAARAPELMSIRHRNTASGGVRNVFIDGGLVLFVTAYHKGYEYSERTKVIQRFLPREVGELVVYYLWLALPFIETLRLVVDGVDQLSAFVWGDEQSNRRQEIEEDDSSEEEEGRDEEGEGEERTRVGHRGGKLTTVNSELPELTTGPGISPAGRVKSSVCSQGAWTSERMRRIMQRESKARIGVRLNISAWRQMSIAIARKFIREEYRFDIGGSEESGDFDEDSHEDNSAWDLQSGHGTRMAGMIYGRLLFEGAYETQTQREKFRQVSQEWHQFLGFKSAMDGFGVYAGMKRKKPYWEQVNKEMQELRWKQLRHANVQGKLETMLGADAKFRGVQRPGINAIIQGQSPILVVMGTGGGKSMLFMLPAACTHGGCTIVIVPLVALQGDLQQRCEKAMISSVVWDSQRPYESASIVFVTPESAVSKTFAGFINRLQEMHQLDRIVIDECHTILDGNAGFRPKLRQLGQLVAYAAQMVYLTATLPPREEEEFRRLMYIPATGLHMFRDRTTRKNIIYQVQDVQIPESTHPWGWEEEGVGFEPAIHEAVSQLVRQKLEVYAAPAKMIIYCSDITGAEGLAEALECELYHRNVDSKDGKYRRLEDWRNARDDDRAGQGRVIVATNALGLGVDVPDIRVVIHVGRVYALRDYAQESGRAGRDGQRSEAIIVRGVGAGAGAENCGGDKSSIGQVDIKEFIDGRVCRRVILDQVMDAPRARVGCEEGEEVCDVCMQCDEAFDNNRPFSDSGIGSSGQVSSSQMIGSSPPALRVAGPEVVVEAGPEAYMQQRRWIADGIGRQQCQEGMEIKELIEYLEEWSGKCPLCYAYDERDVWHDISECRRDGAEKIKRDWIEMKEGIKYEDFSCCFECGIPQGICEQWEQVEERGWWQKREGRRCQYEGVLIYTVITMLGEGADEVLEDVYRWIQEFGVDIRDKKMVNRWMGQRVEWGGLEASRVIQLFYRLARQFRV